jgi:hypothetical protein
MPAFLMMPALSEHNSLPFVVNGDLKQLNITIDWFSGITLACFGSDRNAPFMHFLPSQKAPLCRKSGGNKDNQT